MQAPDVSPQPASSSVLGVIRLIAAAAIVIVAGIAALVVLDVLPSEVVSQLAYKVLLVAAIAVGTVGIVTVLVGSHRR